MKKVYYYVVVGLTRISPFALLAKARNMVELMTGNPAFATPVPALAVVSAAADRLEAAINAFVLNPGPRERSERDMAFDALKGVVVDLAGYVQSASNGDRKVIESAGLAVRRDPSPVGELPAPTGVTAQMNPIQGRIDVRWSATRGRLFYRLFICSGDPADEKSWELLVQTGKNRFAATDLQSDKVYFFRVQAQGVAGLSALSEVANAKAA
jgi:hypothetical protein